VIRDAGEIVMREALEHVRSWATQKIQGGSEPPWAWYQYMKLIESVDAILSGMDATITLQDSLGSERRSETHLRLVARTDLQDSAPRHPSESPVSLPM
jgi:hypothetical protein